MDFSEDYADTILDPALTSQWLIRLPNLESGQIFAESLSLPFRKIPAKARHNAASNSYFPDFNDIDAVTIVFYENYNYETTKWVNGWRKKVVSEDGYYGLPVNYKVTGQAEFYPAFSDSPSLIISFVGMWPTEQGSIEYTNDDASGRVKVSVPFSIDTVAFLPSSEGGSGLSDTPFL